MHTTKTNNWEEEDRNTTNNNANYKDSKNANDKKV